MKAVPLCIAALLAVTLAGCDDWKAKAPPETTAGQQPQVFADSTIRVPVTIRTAALTAAVMETYRAKPVSEGRSPEINAKLLVDEEITVERAVEILISPHVPAACVVRKVPREIIRIGKIGVEGYGCALTPWRWGRCWRDVVGEIRETKFDDITECVAEQIAKYKTMLQPIVEINHALFPTSIWVEHDLNLRDLKLAAQGNRIKLVGDLKLSVAVDVRQGALGAKMTIKGALNCDSDLTLTAEAEVHVTKEATLDVSIKDVDLDWRKVCIPGAVEALDLIQLLNPVLKAQSKLIGEGLNQILKKELNRAIQDSTKDDLNFRDDLIRATPKIRQAHAIGDQLWLEFEPKMIVVSDVRGVGEGAANALTIDVGYVGRPRLSFGAKPPLVPDAPIGFELSEGPAGFTLAVEGVAPLPAAQEKLAALLRKAVDEKYGSQPFATGPVRLYQSGDRLVAGLDVLKRSSGERLGTVYLWARPVLSDDRSSIGFADVAFDVDSRNMLVKTASWLLDGVAEKAITDAKILVSGAIAKLLDQQGTIASDIGIGQMNGVVRTLEPAGIWLGDGALRVAVIGRGDARIDLKAPKLD